MKTHIAKSNIEGMGLFANENIKKNTYIGTYNGRKAKRDGKYILWLDDEPYYITNKFRFVNHSKKPNAELENFELHSIKRIKKGEEITIHYGKDWL